MSTSVSDGDAGEIALEVDSSVALMDKLLDGKGGKDAPAARTVEAPVAPPKKDEPEAPTPGDLEVDEKPDEEEEEAGEAEEPEEEEEEQEEEQELKEATAPAILRDLKKKYPDIVKEFPPLKNILHRESQFSQVFLSPEDAAESYETLEAYKEFERELFSADSSKAIDAIRNANPNGFKQFAGNFLENLHQTDRGTYAEVITPVLVSTLQRALKVGEARQDTNIINSVAQLASLLWPEGKGQLPTQAARKAAPSPEEQERLRKLEEREQRLVNTERSRFVQSVRVTTDKLFQKYVEKDLDPKGTLTPYIKDVVVEKTMTDIRHLMDNDEQFGRTMVHLLTKASKSGYTEEFRTRMVGTYVGRVKQLLGPIRRRHLNHALGVTPGKDTDQPPIRRAVGTGTPTGKGGKVTVKSSQIDWTRSSDLDILNAKPTLRKGK